MIVIDPLFSIQGQANLTVPWPLEPATCRWTQGFAEAEVLLRRALELLEPQPLPIVAAKASGVGTHSGELASPRTTVDGRVSLFKRKNSGGKSRWGLAVGGRGWVRLGWDGRGSGRWFCRDVVSVTCSYHAGPAEPAINNELVHAPHQLPPHSSPAHVPSMLSAAPPPACARAALAAAPGSAAADLVNASTHMVRDPRLSHIRALIMSNLGGLLASQGRFGEGLVGVDVA